MTKKLELIWPGKDEPIRPEPRILIERSELLQLPWKSIFKGGEHPDWDDRQIAEEIYWEDD